MHDPPQGNHGKADLMYGVTMSEPGLSQVVCVRVVGLGVMKTTVTLSSTGELVIEQPEEGPRVSVDIVLLASFVKAKGRERILELGSAHGAVSASSGEEVPDTLSRGLQIQCRTGRHGGEERHRQRPFRKGWHSGRVTSRRVREIYGAQSFAVVVVNPALRRGKPQPPPALWSPKRPPGTARTARLGT
jgi:hypothetical protein